MNEYPGTQFVLNFVRDVLADGMEPIAFVAARLGLPEPPNEPQQVADAVRDYFDKVISDSNDLVYDQYAVYRNPPPPASSSELARSTPVEIVREAKADVEARGKQPISNESEDQKKEEQQQHTEPISNEPENEEKEEQQHKHVVEREPVMADDAHQYLSDHRPRHLPRPIGPPRLEPWSDDSETEEDADIEQEHDEVDEDRYNDDDSDDDPRYDTNPPIPGLTKVPKLVNPQYEKPRGGDPTHNASSANVDSAQFHAEDDWHAFDQRGRQTLAAATKKSDCGRDQMRELYKHLLANGHPASLTQMSKVHEAETQIDELFNELGLNDK